MTDIYLVRTIGEIAKLPDTITSMKGLDLTDREVLGLARFAHLKSLDLSGCSEITDKSVLGLQSLFNLEVLDLSLCNQISDVLIEVLPKLPLLRWVNLNWCYNITDHALFTMSKCKRIESVFLWSCERVTDGGVMEIAKLPKLKQLELPEFSQISDAALVAISLQSEHIEVLRLAKLSKISDDGIKELGNLKLLRKVIVRECPNVTKSGISDLQTAIPACEILFQT